MTRLKANFSCRRYIPIDPYNRLTKEPLISGHPKLCYLIYPHIYLISRSQYPECIPTFSDVMRSWNLVCTSGHSMSAELRAVLKNIKAPPNGEPHTNSESHIPTRLQTNYATDTNPTLLVLGSPDPTGSMSIWKSFLLLLQLLLLLLFLVCVKSP